MLEFLENLPLHGQCFIGLFGVYILWTFVLKKLLFSGKRREPEIRKKDWQKDVVYLYQFPRPRYVPNMSPFCLKVETWLRIADVKYEVCYLVFLYVATDLKSLTYLALDTYQPTSPKYLQYLPAYTPTYAHT